MSILEYDPCIHGSVLSLLPSLIKKLIKGIIESLKIINDTDNCLRSLVKRPMFAEPHLDGELSTNKKCLQQKLRTYTILDSL